VISTCDLIECVCKNLHDHPIKLLIIYAAYALQIWHNKNLLSNNNLDIALVWKDDYSTEWTFIYVVLACGVIATVVVVLCLLWVGVVDDVPMHTEGTTTLRLSSFPVAVGLYGYCFAGHAVFPNLYTAMANRNQFPKVLLTW